MQSGGKWEMAEAGEQAQDGDRGVKVESGGESDGGQQREEFGGRDLEDVEHFVGDDIITGSVMLHSGEIGFLSGLFRPVRNDNFGVGHFNV
jgi:hypothetical protein